MSVNKYTKEKLAEMRQVLLKGRNLLLTGGSGVGKTFLAKELAKNLLNKDRKKQNLDPEYCIEKLDNIEIVCFHPEFCYEDFVSGIYVSTEDNKVKFETVKRVFLNVINKAKESENKHILILDDINRVDISSVFGELLTLLESHNSSQSNSVTLSTGDTVSMPKNLYIIATMNTSITTPFKMDYAFLRRFSTIELESDFKYIKEDKEENTLSAIHLYERAKHIVKNSKSSYYIQNENEKIKYLPGHGYFTDGDANEKAYLDKVEHQVLPLLKQYVKDGILDESDNTKIKSLEDDLSGVMTTDYEEIRSRDIEIKIEEGGSYYNLYFKDKKKDKNYKKEFEKPISNKRVKNDKNDGDKNYKYIKVSDSAEKVSALVQNLINNKLISNADMFSEIIDSEKIVTREKNKKAHLYATKDKRIDIRSAGGVYCYNEKKHLKIDGKEYYQPSQLIDTIRLMDKELDEKKFKKGYECGTSAISGNSLINLIIITFYNKYINNLDRYIKYLKEDKEIETNILDLMKAVEDEKEYYIEESKKKANEIKIEESYYEELRKIIQKLGLLWAKPGDEVNFIDKDGKKSDKKIKVLGVYSMENNKNYIEIMDKLKIRQMILQGPPGTSKTYTAKEMIYEAYEEKGGGNRDEELKKIQIEDYEKSWDKTIGWDMVQFHPSYGYEDFIRGITVETKGNGEYGNDGKEKQIVSYDTLNKTLGKIAEFAEKNKGDDDNNKNKFFLIIDEINRANIATVFGELIYALEYRGESVSTPYTVKTKENGTDILTSKITIPDNLYIIGTMNTSDKSIGGVDYAIRRRFLFFPLLPDVEVIEKYYESKEIKNEDGTVDTEISKKAVNLFKNIGSFFEKYLSSEYHKDDVQIGHTYFLIDNDSLDYRFEYQIIPILREYYKDGLLEDKSPNKDIDKLKRLYMLISGEKTKETTQITVDTIYDELIIMSDI